MLNPLVSAIVIAYNGERFLAEALRSIEAQDYSPIEVLVVDDGSTDRTAAIARSFDFVRYIYQPNRGEAAARNTGVQEAEGAVLAFLDADDLWAPSKISTHINHFRQHPHIGYAFAHMQVFLEPGTEWPPWLDTKLKTQAAPSYLPSALVACKSVIEEVGHFDPSYRHCCDLDWLIRARDASIPFAVLPETLAYRRIHGANMTYRREAVDAARFRALRASIKRKRSQHGLSSVAQ